MNRILLAFFGMVFFCFATTPTLALDLAGSPMFQALDSNGEPLSGGKLHTYEPGSTTAKTAYQDKDGNTAHANPIVLDSRGEAEIWFNGSYKLILRDSDDVLIWTIDNFSGTGIYYDTASATSGYIAISAQSGTSEVRFVSAISGASIVSGTLVVSNSDLPSPLTSGVSTTNKIIGGVSVYNLTSSQTLTSEMMHGSYVGNYGASSEVTYTLLTAFQGASLNISLDQDQTSGSSIWVVFPSGDKILNKPNFVAGSGSGTSYYFLSGTTGEKITLIGKGSGIWDVMEYGSPSQNTVN